MKTDPLVLFYALFVFLSVGVILGAWNDLVRFVMEILLCTVPMKNGTARKMRESGRIVLDLLFCLLAGISVIVLLFYFNEGKIRGFALAAPIVGFVLYRGTMGRLWGKAVMPLSKRIGRALNRAVYYLILPLYRLFLGTIHAISLPIAACRKRILRQKMVRYDVMCRKMLNEKSKKGFVDI